MRKIFYLFLLSVIFFSCKKDPPILSDMPNEIRYEYDLFFTEGQKRGYNLEKKYVKIVFTNTNFIKGVYCDGLTDFNNHIIYLDTSSLKYKITKEAMLFHEMGHYYLNREHRNNCFSDSTNDPISIMNCCIMPNYTNMFGLGYKREYYINELFNENTPVPNWSNN